MSSNMDARTLASFALSFLVVALAAVGLHRPEPPPASSKSSRQAPRVPKPQAAADAAPEPPPLTPGMPWSERAAQSPRSAEPAATAGAEPAHTGSAARMKRVSQRGPRRRPRSAFTTVAPGEDLADVALRVYGDEDARQALWLANRDQLPTPDAPLRAGTSLRTP